MVKRYQFVLKIINFISQILPPLGYHVIQRVRLFASFWSSGFLKGHHALLSHFHIYLPNLRMFLVRSLINIAQIGEGQGERHGENVNGSHALQKTDY